MSSPDKLVDRQEILNALAVHSRGVDRADANLLASAYHDDATVDYGFFAGPAADLVAMLVAGQKASLPTLHRTSSSEIRIEQSRAVSESYVIAYAEAPDVQRLVLGRYLDTLERRGGAWRISHRIYVMDGNINRTSTVVRGDPPASHVHFVPEGAHGASDPGRALLALHEAGNRALREGSTMSADSLALDAALSRDAIRLLVTSYSRGVDRGDEALLASLFWEDSTVISGVSNASGAEFARQIVEYVTQNLKYCFHSVANEWIEVKGDHAVGEHYVIAHMATGGQDVMTGGRYIDSYVRRDGVWKIHTRTFVADWNTTHPESMELDGMYEALKNRGSFGPNDPVYALWAGL